IIHVDVETLPVSGGNAPKETARTLAVGRKRSRCCRWAASFGWRTLDGTQRKQCGVLGFGHSGEARYIQSLVATWCPQRADAPPPPGAPHLDHPVWTAADQQASVCGQSHGLDWTCVRMDGRHRPPLTMRYRPGQ